MAILSLSKVAHSTDFLFSAVLSPWRQCCFAVAIRYIPSIAEGLQFPELPTAQFAHRVISLLNSNQEMTAK
jgi:hypothetical protein